MLDLWHATLYCLDFLIVHAIPSCIPGNLETAALDAPVLDDLTPQRPQAANNGKDGDNSHPLGVGSSQQDDLNFFQGLQGHQSVPKLCVQNSVLQVFEMFMLVNFSFLVHTVRLVYYGPQTAFGYCTAHWNDIFYMCWVHAVIPLCYVPKAVIFVHRYGELQYSCARQLTGARMAQEPLICDDVPDEDDEMIMVQADVHLIDLPVAPHGALLASLSNDYDTLTKAQVVNLCSIFLISMQCAVDKNSRCFHNSLGKDEDGRISAYLHEYSFPVPLY